MARLALVNMVIGFSLIFFAASAGAFLATEAESAFLHNPELLQSYAYKLQKSAHAHTNLFGMIHILFALTMNYSRLSEKSKKWQTLGFSSGSLCVSFLLLAKSTSQPVEGLGLLSIVAGAGLSMFLLSLFFHCVGLFMKLRR